MADFQLRSGPAFRIKDTETLFTLLKKHLVVKKDVTLSRLPSFVLQHLWRPAQLGTVLDPDKKLDLLNALQIISQALSTDINPDDLHAFSEAAIDAAHRCVHELRHPGSALKDTRCRREGLIDSPKQLIKATVYAEYARADSDAEVVHNAVKRALAERRRENQKSRYLRVEEKDPLRQMFALPDKGRAIRFSKGDIRHIMMNKHNSISSVLREASAFSLEVLQPALGEEFSRICRPIGFADARKTRLLIEVRSNAVAQKLHFQKNELLERLRKINGLERILDFRFTIKGQ